MVGQETEFARVAESGAKTSRVGRAKAEVGWKTVMKRPGASSSQGLVGRGGNGGGKGGTVAEG